MTTTICIDSGTQAMIPASHGDTIVCGNCGQPVLVLEAALRANDPDDHNTIRVLAEHTAT